MSKYADLIFEKKDGVTRITLNRPKKHNALTISLQKQLHEAIRSVKLDLETRVLIIRGAGNTFCAGDDIPEMPRMAELNVSSESIGAVDTLPASTPMFMFIRMFRETAAMLEDLDCVTIAAVDGLCMGGGLELTLCCDFVLTTPDARWGMPEIDMGITAGWGGCTRMQRYVGRRKCKEINRLAYEFSGRDAADWGLADCVVPAKDLKGEVPALTDLILAKSRYAIRRTKFVLNKAAEGHLAQATAFEVPVDRGAGPGENTQGIRNFADKPHDWFSIRDKSRSFWPDQRR